MFSYTAVHIEDFGSASIQLIRSYPLSKIFLFQGPMGSGKTTFIKAICKTLGVTGTTSSPSFSIVNEYEIPNGLKIYHFDFYRIKNTEEAYDLGYEDYFYSNNYCLIEWPEKIEDLIPAESVRVSIKLRGTERHIRTKP